jgi:hypothetical protein
MTKDIHTAAMIEFRFVCIVCLLTYIAGTIKSITGDGAS